MEDLGGSERALCDTVMVDTGHRPSVHTRRMYNTKSELNMNYGLWVMMVCQCGLINCNQCTTVEGAVDNGVTCALWRRGGIWGTSVPSPQLYCAPKTALKNKSGKKQTNILTNLTKQLILVITPSRRGNHAPGFPAVDLGAGSLAPPWAG